MLNATFRPLDLKTWPDRSTQGTIITHFKAGYNDTLDLLERELSWLDARDVIIQIQIHRDDIRNDGWPKGNARVDGAKVALMFHDDGGPRGFYCDHTLEWRGNLRCIALTLERLRLAGLYGVCAGGEQYAGFKALPPGDDRGAGEVELDVAIAKLSSWSGIIPELIRNDAAYFQQAQRKATMRCHPDRGGSSDSWADLQKCVRVLEAHHKVKR